MCGRFENPINLEFKQYKNAQLTYLVGFNFWLILQYGDDNIGVHLATRNLTAII